MEDVFELESVALPQSITYILDSNVLIHDPNALLNFEEHRVVIPMTVLEELDKLKSGKTAVAADSRQAIRTIDKIVGSAIPSEIAKGIPINREGELSGTLSIMMERAPDNIASLSQNVNDNKIIKDIMFMQHQFPSAKLVLVTKDINMRLKARGCGIESEDYHSDQQVSDIDLLNKGVMEVSGNFWDNIEDVHTENVNGQTYHAVEKSEMLMCLNPNDFIFDEQGFAARVTEVSSDSVRLLHLQKEALMNRQVWGLRPLDIYQAFSLNLLMDPDIQLVNLNGPAGSGKTILALAAAIELSISLKRYKRIIATRSTQSLDDDIGFLPGTEQEKMEPWLGAITDNLEALHFDDDSPESSIDYVLEQVPIQFKSLNYIRGRSFQESLIIIDECQNLTPHQMKTILTRAGKGSKVICLGNLAQIDTPYLSPISSGLTYLTERFSKFPYGGSVHLVGVPRSDLAAFAEESL